MNTTAGRLPALGVAAADFQSQPYQWQEGVPLCQSQRSLLATGLALVQYSMASAGCARVHELAPASGACASEAAPTAAARRKERMRCPWRARRGELFARETPCGADLPCAPRRASSIARARCRCSPALAG